MGGGGNSKMDAKAAERIRRAKGSKDDFARRAQLAAMQNQETDAQDKQKNTWGQGSGQGGSSSGSGSGSGSGSNTSGASGNAGDGDDSSGQTESGNATQSK